MKRILVLLSLFVASCLLLSSCVSLFPQVEEKTVSSPIGNRERISAAVNLLGADMIVAVLAEPVSPADFVSVLPDSYCQYAEYVPSYETLTDNYLKAAAGYAYEILCSNHDLLTDEVVRLARMPNEYISGDTTLSDKIRSNLWNRFYDGLVAELRRNREKLEEYYAPSHRYFEEVRKAYANLDNVGVSFILSSPEAISLESLAETVTDVFFDKLAWYEKFLKNTPAEAGTLYTVFWEN